MNAETPQPRKKRTSWIRAVTVGLLGIVFLAVLAFGYLIQSFDPNDYREEIVSFVEAQTGSSFTIDGDMKLRLKPPLIGFEARNVQLGDSRDSPTGPLLEARRIEGYLNFLPLLTGELHLHSVHAEGPKVRLYRRPNGSTNWERLVAGEEEDASPGTEQEDPALSVYLQEIHIADGHVQYHDDFAGHVLDVEIPHFTLSDIGADRIATLDISTAMHRRPLARTEGAPDTAEILLRATLEASPGFEVLSVRDLTVQTELYGPGFRFERMRPQASVRQLVLDIPNGMYSAQGLQLQADTAQVRMDSLDIRNTDGSTRVEATVGATGISPRHWVESWKLPVRMPADDGAMTAVEFHTDVRMHLAGPSLSEIRLSGLRARIDDTDVTGEFSLLGFEQPRVGLDLKIGAVDLDRYFPLDEAIRAQPAAGDETKPQHPTTGLQRLDGSIRFEQLRWQGLELASVDTEFGADPSRYELHSLDGSLNGSPLRASGNIDISGGIPAYRMDMNLEQLEIGQILSLVTDNDDTPLEGSTDLKLSLNSRGYETDRFLSSLTGTVGIVVRNGVLHVGSVAHAVESAIAVLQGRKGRTTSEGTLPFDLLRSSWKATDGRFHSNDLVLDADAVRVTGQGHLDVAKQEADYRIVLQLGEGLTVPGSISGPFDDLSHSVDLSSLLRDQVSRQFKNFFGGEEEEDAPEDPEESEDDPLLPVPNLIRDLF